MIRRTACLIARDVDPYRNLAIEKHLMDTLPEETAILYLWQNRQTVMIGRMQNPWYECPVDQFTMAGGLVARRLSGGGAAYQDSGSLNATLIMPKNEFDIPRQLSILGMAAGSFGIQAQLLGRQDLGVDGRMFCTNAFFKGGSAAMHQATLYVKSDLEAQSLFTTVEEGKLPQNFRRPAPETCNLSRLNEDITIDSLEESIYRAFARVYGAEPAMLDERMLDSRSIERLTQQFCSREWILPPSFPYTFSVAERFPWGGVAVRLMAEGGIIRAAKVYTDAMEAGLFEQIEQALVGSPYLISAIAGRFEQKLAWLRGVRLTQMAGDVCTLICGRIRAMDRSGGQGAGSLKRLFHL